MLQHARRNKKDVSIIWLNLQDAFGSVPHNTLFTMLERAGLSSSTLDIIKNIYTGSIVRVKTDYGLTPPITITKGVKQGCPLSPILFNFIIEGALEAINHANQGYQMGETTVKSLAFADDLCLISEKKETVNRTLASLHEYTSWAGLSFSVHKCAALTCINSTSK